jgi:hypothetical protein
MPIGKFDRFVQKNWDWKTSIPTLPQLDVAGFQDVMNQQQSQIDQVGLLSDKKPNVLNNQPDMELYQTYKQDVDKALNHVSEEYSKGVTSGQLAYKNYLQQFRKDWSPGGRADILNKRSEAYQTGLKAIDEFYKSDASPVNKTLAKKQLADQLKNPISVNPTTGQFTSITTPELYKDAEVNKAVDEMLKEIKANGDTSFLGTDTKDWWIKKIQTETREPERIKLAYQALSQQPQYASQIERDTEYKALQTDPTKYQAAYESKQKSALDQLTQANEKAKSDPNAAKELQNLLRQEGYNVTVDGQYGPMTEKAAKEYLDQKKKDVQGNIQGFNLKDQLRNDVNQSYQNYALRGAYEKRDIDLTFNQAKKAIMDDARKREENQINRDRLNFEFNVKDQSQILAVDGIAQQLPEIQKQYQDTKASRDQLKAKLDQTLSQSKAFNGWKMEDVGQAYQKWQQVQGNTEAEKKANYKAALNQGSAFQFTDQQVDLLYQEMNAPDGQGTLKTSLQGYSQAQNEVSRYEDGQKQIAAQYVNTPKGKESIKQLRDNSPEAFKQLSDQELVQKAITNPEQFEKNKTLASKVGGMSVVDFPNPAERFNQQLQTGVKSDIKNGKSYDWGVLGTTEIYAGTKDTTLKPIYDMVAGAIETGTGNNFSTFGLAGLRFKDNKGDDLEDSEAKKVSKVAVTKDMNGNPILKVGVTVTKPNGKSEDGYTEVSLVPGSALIREVQSGLTNAYLSKINAGETIAAQGILDNLDAIQGRNGITEAAIDVQTKSLNLLNTKDEGLLTVNPQTGEVVPISSLGWQSKDLNNDATIAGRNYKTYGLNTPSGNYLANVIVDPATGAKVLVPSLDGSSTFSSASGIQKDRLGKQLQAAAGVIVTKTKQ